MKLRSKKEQGVTIIELLVVVVIIGILFTTALPAYREYVLVANRSEGISAISDILDAQERFYAANSQYTTNITQLGFASNPLITRTGLYSVAAQSCAAGTLAQCVQVTATARGEQVPDGNLVFDTTGTRTVNGQPL